MPTEFRDRFTPTAVGLVSRAWVIEEVEGRVSDSVLRSALIDELVGYEPPRQHALRNMFLFWLTAIAASALAGELDFPRWTGFVGALALFAWLARLLAVKALRWRLDQWLAERGATGPGP
jgi:protein-S-isoprenylcysteine O-methyltransferase Ste14